MWRASAFAAVALVASIAHAFPQQQATPASVPDTVRVLPVPFVAQPEALCGGAAAAMVLRYWGVRGIYAEDFAPLVTQKTSGIRTGDLVTALDTLGWQAYPFRGTAREVRPHLEAGRPIIALLKDRPERYHYVVLVAWTDQGVLFHDPAIGPNRFLGTLQLDRAWKPTDYWALLVLPKSDVAEPAPPDGGTASRYTPAEPLPAACEAFIAEAIRHAQRDALDEAEAALQAAMTHCPEEPAVLREQAGLRFRRKRWNEAAALAERALSGNAASPYTWRLLASSRYLAGDLNGALDAWNRVDEPRVDLVQITGLERTRHAAVAELMTLEAGRLLTSARLERTRRRLMLLPSAVSTAVRYQPVSGGIAEIHVTIVERPLLLGGWPGIGGLLVEAATRKQATFSLTGAIGGGERLTATWRWQTGRPRVALNLTAPVPGLPGMAAVAGFWERQSYRVASTREPIREEHRHGGVRLTDWATARLRWTAAAALDRWDDRGLHAGLEGGLTYRLGRRWQVQATAAGWIPLKESASFAIAQGALRRKDNVPQDAFGWSLDLGLQMASARSPLALWNGAGTGQGREALLRAHPLLDNGIIIGAVFGRTLAFGSIEARHWLGRLGPLRLGPAAFADAAAAWRPLDPDAEGRLQMDAGVGVRVQLPGPLGRLRFDAAYGVRDGATALSAGWDQPLR